MAFILELHDDYLQPAITCDRCGAHVPATGFHLWRADVGEAVGADSPAQLCSEDCLEAFTDERSLDEEWVAVPIDAYLVNLIDALSIDSETVRERERAVWAAEHTRHEAPD